MIPPYSPDFGLQELRAALTPGAGRSQFEATVAVRAGARFGVAFAYAHSGFYALLRALNLTGAEIILPAYTCPVMPSVVLATGNVPVLVDIERDGPNTDPRALTSAVTSRTRCIVATHMLGQPLEVRAVREAVGDERVIVLEDAATMFPGSTAGPEGLQGDVGLFSFGPGKPLFALRGGVVVTNRADLYAELVAYREREMGDVPPGQIAKRWCLLASYYAFAPAPLRSLGDRLKTSKRSLQRLTKRKHRPSASGGVRATLMDDYATALTDFQARIGLVQLARSEAIYAERTDQARRYRELLGGIPGVEPTPIVVGSSHTPYTFRLKDRDSARLCARLRARGVGAMYTQFYDLPSSTKYGRYCLGDCPNARAASREIVRLPTYPGLTEGQSQMIAEAISRELRNEARGYA